MAKDTLLALLVASVQRLRKKPLEPALEAKAQVCLLDYLAAACAGAGNATAVAGRNAAACFGPGGCTLIGQPKTGSVAAAALYNGLLGHAEELDDSHRYVSGMHLGTTIIPAALALAEELDAPGELLLRAVVCGYEAAGRVIRCMDKEHRARGFHATGTVGPFGAAAACSVLLGLDPATMGQSIAIAASTSAGLFAFLENGASVKHLHAGRPPLDGLMAALLAQGGMTGPDTVFEGREGFFQAYAGAYTAAPLSMDLGDAEITRVYHKLHSACGHSFPAVDAALALRGMLQRKGIDETAVRSVTFRTYAAAAILTNAAPRTIQEARFSLPFVFALALVKGSAARASFTPDIVRDEAVLAVCSRMRILEDPAISDSFPRLRAGEMTAELYSGETFRHRVDSPLGMPDNPVSLEELKQKFRTEALPLLPRKAVDDIVALAGRAARLPSIRPLTALLRG